MDPGDHISSFMNRAKEDPRIGPMHISLYMAILYRWSANGSSASVKISARGLMPLAKIAGLTAYHRSIRQLNEYGYIRYEPSFDPAKPSKVYLPE
jgi:hypothetical protein